MEFVDRVSAYPNRYLMTTEDGRTSYVVLERADEPVTVGTPLNAETLNPMAEEVEKLRAEVDAMKGVDIGVRPGDNRTQVDPTLFDYFLLYRTEDDRAPLVFDALEYSSANERFTAVHYHGIENVPSADQQPTSFLTFFAGQNGEWSMEYVYWSAENIDSYPSYYRVYGFKYPILGVE